MNHRSAKRGQKKTLKASMPRRPSLFWDVDPKTIDPRKHAQYVIERVLDFGDRREVQWLTHHYSPRRIGAAVRKSRVLLNKSRALWELVFK